jgi:hypothetical protein
MSDKSLYKYIQNKYFIQIKVVFHKNNWLLLHPFTPYSKGTYCGPDSVEIRFKFIYLFFAMCIFRSLWSNLCILIRICANFKCWNKKISEIRTLRKLRYFSTGLPSFVAAWSCPKGSPVQWHESYVSRIFSEGDVLSLLTFNWRNIW